MASDILKSLVHSVETVEGDKPHEFRVVTRATYSDDSTLVWHVIGPFPSRGAAVLCAAEANENRTLNMRSWMVGHYSAIYLRSVFPQLEGGKI